MLRRSTVSSKAACSFFAPCTSSALCGAVVATLASNTLPTALPGSRKRPRLFLSTFPPISTALRLVGLGQIGTNVGSLLALGGICRAWRVLAITLPTATNRWLVLATRMAPGPQLLLLSSLLHWRRRMWLLRCPCSRRVQIQLICPWPSSPSCTQEGHALSSFWHARWRRHLFLP